MTRYVAIQSAIERGKSAEYILRSQRSLRILWRYLGLTMLLIALLAPRVAAAQSTDSALVVPADQRVDGDVATVTQNIRVEGVVGGDVTSWSGDIIIAGRVGGDVVSYAGRVTVAANGQVDGHVLALGGGARREASAVVRGQLLDGGGGGGALASVLDILAPATPNARADTAIGRALFGAALGILLLAFCLILAAFWPQRTAVAGATLRRLPGRALALGLLTTIGLAALLPPVAALLAATIIGLPLLGVLVLIIQAPYVYGVVALATAVRDPVGKGAPHPATIATAAVIAVLLAIITAIAPLWGLALFYIAASPGLGAVILSHGGLAAPAVFRPK